MALCIGPACRQKNNPVSGPPCSRRSGRRPESAPPRPASSYARRRGARLPMPSPPKERPSDCLGHLLAALRPSLSKPASPPPSPTLSSRTMAASRSTLPYPPSAGSAAPPLGLRHPLPFPHRRRHPRRLRTSPPPSPDAVDVSLSDQPVRPARRDKGGGFGLGLGFLAFSGVVSLAPLMI